VSKKRVDNFSKRGGAGKACTPSFYL